MAAFAISEGYAEMQLWTDAMSGVEAAVDDIKAAWNNGLKDLENLEDGPVKLAHQDCDPNPRDAKTTLTELVAVGACLSDICKTEMENMESGA